MTGSGDIMCKIMYETIVCPFVCGRGPNSSSQSGTVVVSVKRHSQNGKKNSQALISEEKEQVRFFVESVNSRNVLGPTLIYFNRIIGKLREYPIF